MEEEVDYLTSLNAIFNDIANANLKKNKRQIFTGTKDEIIKIWFDYAKSSIHHSDLTDEKLMEMCENCFIKLQSNGKTTNR